MAQRFTTRRWVLDPAARRQALKALAVLRGAHTHIAGTWAEAEDDASFAAEAIIAAALGRVQDAEDAAHRAAR